LEFLVRRLQRGERVLNVGVGNGTLERLATMKGCDVWCLDPSEQAIDRLRTELQLGERAKVGFSQAMPFPDEHFDVVVMSEVLEHLDPDVFQTTLSEVRRVLRKGGRFIGTVPARERLEDSLVVCSAAVRFTAGAISRRLTSQACQRLWGVCSWWNARKSTFSFHGLA
jgi:ubiquinone/menaquinone biosynthesis C-methylase UbiE